ncbi:hypothetical protein OEA41_004635 [Lepraria neglecta]|uniref:Mediator of RNA polymerase II transcription subunit 9 n=1 Tax=Lepraria neglecta TaxID=209136 RepID=A0AAE0DG21_9LECA|nr:hypothetical protein OEA41_004635 [Lepraria neglecta]
MPTATATTPNPSQTTTKPLPPPQTFDILPPLHALLSRLLLPNNGAEISSPSPDTVTPISPKDLATAASSITAKIQKARAAVRDLPGVEMGIEEQDDVIRELEEEVRRLRGVQEGISRVARDGMRGLRQERGKHDAEKMEET